jgi:hypothetical protein
LLPRKHVTLCSERETPRDSVESYEDFTFKAADSCKVRDDHDTDDDDKKGCVCRLPAPNKFQNRGRVKPNIAISEGLLRPLLTDAKRRKAQRCTLFRIAVTLGSNIGRDTGDPERMFVVFFLHFPRQFLS